MSQLDAELTEFFDKLPNDTYGEYLARLCAFDPTAREALDHLAQVSDDPAIRARVNKILGSPSELTLDQAWVQVAFTCPKLMEAMANFAEKEEIYIVVTGDKPPRM